MADQPAPGAQDELLSLVFREWGGMNSTASRQGLAPTAQAWMENVIPLDNGNATVVPNKQTVVSALGETINSIDTVTISGTSYVVAATASGNVYAWVIGVWTKITVKTGLATSGITFASWQNTQLLILDPTNGYFNWPGSGTAVLVSGTLVGTTIANYSGRVWINNGRTISFSAPNSFSDFTVADGGGSFIVTDEYMEGAVLRLIASQDWLYILGNGCVLGLNNVQLLAGNITTYSVTNLSSSGGVKSYTGAVVYQRALVTANAHGVDGYYGLTSQKVSSDMDGFFSNVTITANIGAFLGTVYNQVCLHVLVTYTPNGNVYLASFTSGRWFLMNMGTLTYGTWIAQNGSPQAYVTDGPNIYSLATDVTTVAVTGKIITRFWDAEDATMFKQLEKVGVEVSAPSLTSYAVSWTADNESKSTTAYTPAVPVATGYQWLRQSVNQFGQYFGVTINFTLINATFQSVMFQFRYGKPWP